MFRNRILLCVCLSGVTGMIPWNAAADTAAVWNERYRLAVEKFNTGLYGEMDEIVGKICSDAGTPRERKIDAFRLKALGLLYRRRLDKVEEVVDSMINLFPSGNPVRPEDPEILSVLIRRKLNDLPGKIIIFRSIKVSADGSYKDDRQFEYSNGIQRKIYGKVCRELPRYTDLVFKDAEYNGKKYYLLEGEMRLPDSVINVEMRLVRQPEGTIVFNRIVASRSWKMISDSIQLHIADYFGELNTCRWKMQSAENWTSYLIPGSSASLSDSGFTLRMINLPSFVVLASCQVLSIVPAAYFKLRADKEYENAREYALKGDAAGRDEKYRVSTRHYAYSRVFTGVCIASWIYNTLYCSVYFGQQRKRAGYGPVFTIGNEGTNVMTLSITLPLKHDNH
jgi:hypothetical protein